MVKVNQSAKSMNQNVINMHITENIKKRSHSTTMGKKTNAECLIFKTLAYYNVPFSVFFFFFGCQDLEFGQLKGKTKGKSKRKKDSFNSGSHSSG